MYLTRVSAAATALVALIILSACSAGSAPSDGAESLSLYSGRSEDLIQPLIDRFEAESGFDVQVRYGDTPEMAALLLEEGVNSRADVSCAAKKPPIAGWRASPRISRRSSITTSRF